MENEMKIFAVRDVELKPVNNKAKELDVLLKELKNRLFIGSYVDFYDILAAKTAIANRVSSKGSELKVKLSRTIPGASTYMYHIMARANYIGVVRLQTMNGMIGKDGSTVDLIIDRENDNHVKLSAL
jgi:hypothetical protein